MGLARPFETAEVVTDEVAAAEAEELGMGRMGLVQNLAVEPVAALICTGILITTCCSDQNYPCG